MKRRNIQVLFLTAALTISLSACKKDADNIFNMFDDVAVTFNGTDPLSITDYKQVNEGEEVVIDYTVTSANTDMHSIAVHRAGENRPILTTKIPDNADKRSYSGVYRFTADKAGKTTYRIYAINSKAVYMGDGYKSVTVDVKPNFTFVADRRVYLPDTATRVNPSFFSVSQGKVYSYSEGKANSANIDFGVYRKEVTSNNQKSYEYHLYSLSIAQNPLTVYDFTDWTKRETKFSAPQAGKTSLFNTTLVTSKAIETEAKKVTINSLGTTTKLTETGGQVIFFLTPEGKYGAMHVNLISTDVDKRPYISISVKTQK